MRYEPARHYTFSARLDCHYQLGSPESIGPETLLVVTLHGFGQTAEAMLPLTERMFGQQQLIASLEGPNQFFTDPKTLEVGFGWNTARHSESRVRLHHEMVRHVLAEAGREYGIPAERRILVGFSQSVALNYRFVATLPDEVRGVVGICGGIPGDWERDSYKKVSAAVLHIARRQDEIYPPAVTETYAEKLGTRASDVEFHLMEGGHHFPSRADGIVGRWLERIRHSAI